MIKSGLIGRAFLLVVSTGINFYMSERTRLMVMGGVADVKDAIAPDSGLDENGQLYYIQTRLQIDL